MKHCGRCGQSKPLDDFWKDSGQPDGRDKICAQCRRGGTLSRVEPPPTRVCSKCGQEKPIAKFKRTRKRADGRETICAFCRAPHRNKDGRGYQRQKELVRRRRRDVRKQYKLALIEMLGGKCKKCGLPPSDEYPVDCFDFHHQGDKEEVLNKLLNNMTGWDRMVEEASKCILFCALCHRQHHALIDEEEERKRREVPLP